ncbi:MAG: rRNA pseudouridine synthase [Ruminococcaceae bacterium]|nr:rRNA pseudouridine synthase [Oscillospiraceae bacterium]
MEPIRLQKFVAECGLMSRRAAEKEILAGNITVNGESVEVGRVIDPARDKVRYKGRPVVKKRNSHKLYLMLNKPRGYVTTMSDDKDRRCVASLVEDVGERVYPVGRLDYESEGMLIMTNDGDLANKLMHPKHHIPKTYNVRIEGDVTKAQLKTLNSEMEIDGYTIKPVETKVLRAKNGYTMLEMILTEGRNRQIRKMCEQVGLEITILRRVAVGEIEMTDLRAGKWRWLTKEEIEYLIKY